MNTLKSVAAALALAGFVGQSANAALYINEVLGNTAGTDTEFVEIYNSGPAAVDIGGYQLALYDSDSGGSFGGLDGGSPFVIPAGTSIAAGDYFLFGGPAFTTAYGITPDFAWAIDRIENSSYTMIFEDSSGTNLDIVFVRDAGPTDAPNESFVPVVPSLTVGPDGANLPAGFYRIGDGGSSAELLEFAVPAPSATPGAANPGAIPEPASLAMLGLGGLAVLRRRRSR